MPYNWAEHGRAFEQLARNANPHFERFARSSLRPLMNLLRSGHDTPHQVRQAFHLIARTPDVRFPSKAIKYKGALNYLLQTYPVGLVAQGCSVGGSIKANAARFNQTAIPAAFDPLVLRLVAPCAWVQPTVEDYIIRRAAAEQIGVLIIHMEGRQPGMDTPIDGWQVIDHMKSVLRVANRAGLPLFVLDLQGNLVLDELRPAVTAFGAAGANRLTHVTVHPQHSAFHSAAFTPWLGGKQTVVVMGFDADICVRANLFGVNEPAPAGQRVGLNGVVAPLVGRVAVVTSRAMLVTGGTISPVNHHGEYGLLYGL